LLLEVAQVAVAAVVLFLVMVLRVAIVKQKYMLLQIMAEEAEVQAEDMSHIIVFKVVVLQQLVVLERVE
jgi:hypothetical protein